ncbi:STAS domain-containing protein [Alteromonas flava]|uniref:STAS domain-containing protein n=1 Tax=Alteromonas flava TaxID=2048003 RepID=UPI000C294B42|nr:STAS domain-containing protein [Alteromonas flava]
MTPYSIAVQGGNTLQISGDLTMYTLNKDWWPSASKETLLQLQKQSTIYIALGNVTRIDSAGLAWLLNLIRDAKNAGIAAKLQDPPKELLNLAKISDASPLLPLE